MKSKWSCALIRDLLPSYADGLTSKESNRAVEEHLAECPACAEVLRRMKEQETAQERPAPEVDYLKKVRRHTTRKAWLIGFCLMLLAAAILSWRIFYLGAEINADTADCQITVTGSSVTVDGTLTDSAGVSRVKFSDSDGIVQVTVYTAPKTFWNSSSFHKTYTAAAEVTQVQVEDRVLWEYGVEIGSTASKVFAAKNPYVGDMSANARIAEILGISDQLGTYTNELQTNTEPYGWTVVLKDPIEQNDEQVAQEIMMADSCVMLATVGNLGYVTWRYQIGTITQTYTTTADDAAAFAGQDIKLCGETATALQKLIESLRIRGSGVRDVLSQEKQFAIHVYNQTDADGHETVRCTETLLSVTYAWSNSFTLTGSAETGSFLQEE